MAETSPFVKVTLKATGDHDFRFTAWALQQTDRKVHGRR